MRTLIFIVAIASAAAQEAMSEMEPPPGEAPDTPAGDVATCTFDGASAISDALDSSMFIWASLARCGHTGESIKCEISISSAVTSAISMMNIILKAVDECGALTTANKACGFAASELTKHVAGITASSGSIAQKCTPPKDHGTQWAHADGAVCIINIKNTAKSFFKIVKAFLKLEQTGDCSGGDAEACASNALQIVGAFAGMGEFLSGAIAKCSPPSVSFGGDAMCSAASLRLVQQLITLSGRANDVADTCGAVAPPPAKYRLYSQGSKISAPAAGLPTNLLVAAFLPVTAIVGFVGGRRFAHGGAARATRTFAPMATDELSITE